MSPVTRVRCDDLEEESGDQDLLQIDRLQEERSFRMNSTREEMDDITKVIAHREQNVLTS